MAIFNNPPKVQIAIGLFIAAFLLFFAVAQCHGAVLEFEAGSAIVRGPTPAIGMKVIVPGVISHVGDAACGLAIIGQSTYHYANQPNQIAVGCQVLANLSRLTLGIGVAKLQNDDAYNSGTMNFNLTAQVRLTRQLGIAYNHFSNAGSHMPNLGRDLLVLTWRFE